MIVTLQPEYVAARAVLLDAIAGLGGQAESAILVGAQAVYLRCGEGDLAVAPMTTDADLALNTEWLSDEPELYAAMEAAGFLPGEQPGRWLGRGDVAIDLMIVPHQSGRTGRSARAAKVPPHRSGIARIARGLEAALVDHDVMPVAALTAADPRTSSIKVAGNAAMLVAKLIKLGDRLGALGAGPDRVVAKDALDVLRVLRATSVEHLLAGLERHRSEEHAAIVSAEAIEILRRHGLRRGALLARLASQAAGEDPVIEASFVALADELVSTADSRSDLQSGGLSVRTARLSTGG